MLRITHEETRSRLPGNAVLSIDKEEQPETWQSRRRIAGQKGHKANQQMRKEAKQKYRQFSMPAFQSPSVVVSVFRTCRVYLEEQASNAHLSPSRSSTSTMVRVRFIPLSSL
jgi:hypothetical protein